MRYRLVDYPRSAQGRIHIFGVASHGRSIAPDIDIVIAGKSFCPVIHLCRILSSLDNFFGSLIKRFQTLLQTYGTSVPIVHFVIYISSEITAPRRSDAVIPLSLQIKRLRITAAGYRHIFSVIVQKAYQFRLSHSALGFFKHREYVFIRIFADNKLVSVVQCLIVAYVRLQYLFIIVNFKIFHGIGYYLFAIADWHFVITRKSRACDRINIYITSTRYLYTFIAVNHSAVGIQTSGKTKRHCLFLVVSDREKFGSQIIR